MAWWGSGCSKVGVLLFPWTGHQEKQFSACHLPALHFWDLAAFWPLIVCFDYKERGVGVAFSFWVSGGPAVIRLFRGRKNSKTTQEKIWKLLFSWEEIIHLTLPPS